MAKMTRKAFLKAAGILTATLNPTTLSGRGPKADLQQKGPGGASRITLKNSRFQLVLSPQVGLKVTLLDLVSGMLLTDGDYSYSFGTPSFNRVSTNRRDHIDLVTLEGLAPGAIHVRHEFAVPADRPWVEERITITTQSSHPLALPYGRCGFVLPLTLQDGAVSGPWKDFQFTAIPFRREPLGNRTQYADYTLTQVLSKPRWSLLRAQVPVRRRGNVVNTMQHTSGIIRTLYPEYASEGWCVTDGRRGYLISKYSQEGMEWAVLDRVLLDRSRIGLRWGGFGIFQGDPEDGAWLEPGQSHRFGVTRLTAYEGGILEGFYTFRAEMEARGHGCPKGFNPPVHWNELYDNKLWWLPREEQDEPENRKKYYRLADMKEEAAKAREFGCEALYLDPGWDTNFASKIWDETRLGKLKDFSAMLREEYGLSLSLHTPLSGWCNPSSYSRDIDRMNPDGSRVKEVLCGASRQYIEETAFRLEVLARDGTGYFMFDGTMFNGECWDPKHGHRVPARREEHAQAMNRLARRIHAKFPEVLIEMHDQLLGGTPLRHVPIYYGHGQAPLAEGRPEVAGFDSLWAFELMWDPMTDLVSGHSIALYYYNLAYSVPLYIHIDLRKDNAQALMFWWNASTCRHLGMGGTHQEPLVRAAHKSALAEYRRLKPFFAAGTFYGIDELTHVHRHPTESAAVINCFNLEDHPVNHQVVFEPARFGLDPKQAYEVKGGAARRAGDKYVIDVVIQSYGHVVLEVRSVS